MQADDTSMYECECKILRAIRSLYCFSNFENLSSSCNNECENFSKSAY